jgi:hypothetical protein
MRIAYFRFLSGTLSQTSIHENVPFGKLALDGEVMVFPSAEIVVVSCIVDPPG